MVGKRSNQALVPIFLALPMNLYFIDNDLLVTNSYWTIAHLSSDVNSGTRYLSQMGNDYSRYAKL